MIYLPLQCPSLLFPSSPSLSPSLSLHSLTLFLPLSLSLPQELIPIEVEVSIPYEFHRYIIGQHGKEIRSLMKECSANITIPPSDQQSNIIIVSGMYAKLFG